MSLKFCTDCAHHNYSNRYWTPHPSNGEHWCELRKKRIDPVTGNKFTDGPRLCHLMRNGDCGLKAKYFKAAHKGGKGTK